MQRRPHHDDRGAGLVEYALIVLAIALASLALVANLGDSTADSFNQVADSTPGALAEADTPPEEELTPEEEWAKAKDDYTEAIAEAKARRAEANQQAKDEYNAAVAENKSLPKAERKEANAQAKEQYQAAKSTATSDYKASVQAAKDAKADAKAKYKASK